MFDGREGAVIAEKKSASKGVHTLSRVFELEFWGDVKSDPLPPMPEAHMLFFFDGSRQCRSQSQEDGTAM